MSSKYSIMSYPNELPTDKQINLEKTHSNKNILSYIAPGFGSRFAVNMLFTRMLFFYEIEILLPIVLMTMATAIYTGWDMINDPLIGYRSDRNTRFTKKWGRRFPWMIFSAAPLCITMFLLYLPPDPKASGVWITFWWFLIILLLYDTFEDCYFVPYTSLRVAKFRTLKERTKLQTLIEFITTIGLLLSFLIPPFFVEYGNPASYISLVTFGTTIIAISILLGIPGTREDKDLIESYFIQIEEQEPFFKSFFGLLKNALKNKNFIAYFAFMLAVAIFNLLFVSSVPYLVYYILQADPILELVLYIPYFAAILIPIPLNYYITRRFGHLKVFIISTVVEGIILFIMFFVATNFIGIIIVTAFLGFFIGISNVSGNVVQLDLFDEVAVLNKEREEGAYIGLFTFLTRISFFLQYLIFFIVHTATGFNPKATTQTTFAQFGILLIMVIIPGIFSLGSMIIFIKLYDLKPHKMEKIRAELKELGI